MSTNIASGKPMTSFFPYDMDFDPILGQWVASRRIPDTKEQIEERKQSQDQIAAYRELVNWDNWGFPELPLRRSFERLVTNAWQEKNGYTVRPNAEQVIAYYANRYDMKAS